MTARLGDGPLRTLTLLRHARAQLAPGQRPDDLFSIEDLPLSDQGRAEAEGARGMLRFAAFDAAYASPVLRARETAEIVAAPHGLDVTIVPDLAEMPFGRPGDDYRTILGQIVGLAYLLRDDPDPLLPNGERYSEEKAKFATALASIVAAHERPLVVAHGVANRAWLAETLGMPPWTLFRLAQDHAAVNVVEYDGERPTLALLNGQPPQT